MHQIPIDIEVHVAQGEYMNKETKVVSTRN